MPMNNFELSNQLAQATAIESITGIIENCYTALKYQEELCSNIESKLNMLFGDMLKEQAQELQAKKQTPASIRDAIREIHYSIQSTNKRLDMYIGRLNEL